MSERKHFRDCEELYDFLGRSYEEAFRDHPLHKASIEWLIDRLSPQSSAHVLDVGSGTGVPAAEMLVNAGIKVTGIDVSQEMINIAKRQVPKGDFIRANALKFCPPDNVKYDAVICYFALLDGQTQEELECGYRRIAEWVRPGGYLVLATIKGNNSNAKSLWIKGIENEGSSLERHVYFEIFDDLGLEVQEAWDLDFQADESDLVEPQLFLHMKKPER